MINDPAIRGCNLLIEKLIPVGGEDLSKGKAPAKGKPAAGVIDEISKPVGGEAWFDLIPFLYPGATESTQRCFIKTLKQAKEEQLEGTDPSQPTPAVTGAPTALEGTEGAETSREPSKIFEERNSYMVVKITLSEAINPAIDPGALPRSADIARNAVNNMPQGFPTVNDAVIDYQ
jgi:hypothetical protein